MRLPLGRGAPVHPDDKAAGRLREAVEEEAAVGRHVVWVFPDGAGADALDHLVAVPERLVVLAHEVVDRGALVPALGELRFLLDDRGERLDGGGRGGLDESRNVFIG